MEPECTRRGRAIVVITLALSLFAIAETRTEAQEVEYPAGFDEEATYYAEALGPLTRPITTNSARAQQFFDQGVQMMYAFTPLRAARSFRQAQREDPDCAMCYWGEAWAWGPYLNGPMGPDDAPRAHENIQKAKYLAEDHANDVEKALIDAMAVRYAPEHDNDERRMLDSVYSRAMADVYERFPHDLDVGTLYGESLMLLEPRRGRWNIEKPAVVKIHKILEAVLAMDIAHPGACHLYVHATEPTIKPEKAEACADYLGASIPGASHIQHMPSHTYNRIGRWGDAVRSNLAAWHSDQRAEEDIAWAIYPSHNLHMLLFAASMDGQGAVAMQAARDYGKIVPGGAFYEAMTMLRFGRFDEILELDDPPTGGIQRGFWDFARGYAYLRNDESERASVYLERVRRAAEMTPDGERFRGHSAADLLGVVSGILEGEILRQEGETDRAIEVLDAAIEREDGLRYDEPEPLNFSARHWLGDLLLELERYPEAERVFRAALEDHPMNGWSLFGLEAALRAQGQYSEAERVHKLFQSAWARSDTWITGPIF
ncbi:MAG: tetratricopeptide repeat protein [Deltaproteobacteria bacterium]|nr:tetratricopeptide repeat protein [Deltaproteobacteria bacterium]MDE0035901.1 tetratricopeptide repeat protein [Deltaproteobacteria bacterium]